MAFVKTSLMKMLAVHIVRGVKETNSGYKSECGEVSLSFWRTAYECR